MFGHERGFRDRASVYSAVEERVTWEMPAYNTNPLARIEKAQPILIDVGAEATKGNAYRRLVQ